LRGEEAAVVFQLVLAVMTALSLEHLSGSLALGVLVGSFMVLLHMVQRARAMWRDAHD
jgi:hypothetical protein